MGTPLFFIITKNKKMKKFLSISLVAMLFAGALSSCDGNNPTPPDENLGDTIQVQKITADKEITLFVDSTYQIKVSITPENANEELVWSSDNEKVATVDQKGVVIAIAAGECKISVSTGSVSAVTKVTVINQSAKQTITADEAITLFIDSTYQIKVSVTPENANEPLIWSSDNANVATVDQTGVVTAVAAGECKISVSTGSVSAVTKVTVINQPVTLELELLAVEQDKCTIKMTPSDNKGYYFCTYTTPKEIEGLSEAEIIDKLFKFALAYADQLEATFGKTFIDILHSGSQSQIISGLKANTEYVILAFGVDAEHKIASPKLACLPFKTPEIEMSDMTIEIKLDTISVSVSAGNDTVTKLCFSVTPSKDDPYVCRGVINFEEKYSSVQAYLDYLESNGIESKVTREPQKITANNPKDGDVYTFIAAGYKGGWTTEPFVFSYEYNAATTNKPTRLAPRIESSNNHRDAELNPLEIRPFIRKATY